MSTWPRWSLHGEPASLAKYVLPDEVAALVQLPGPSAGSRIAQAQAVYEALARAGVTYSHEAPSDEPGRQVIREPAEVLWSPRHATCLDLALILAAGYLHSGLHALVLVLDAPDQGRAGHALVGVWIDDTDGYRLPDEDVWLTRPEGWDELAQGEIDGPSRPLLLLDPVGLAHALPASPILGTGAAFPEAARTGAHYAATWTWRLAVDIGRAWRGPDTHTPARRPDDQPLRSPYLPWDAQTYRPLQMLRAEHAVVPFQARDELTVLTDWCHSIATGPHTGIVVVHGVGGAGKTRLALELAHRLATRDGWYTGYLREKPDGRDWLGTVTSPILVVLDYADARTADAANLLATLKRRTERGAVPAVLVMTARSTDGQWLATLRKTWERDGHPCREHPPLHLPPEHPDGTALFRRAVQAFHPGPAAPPTIDTTPQDWTTLDHILLAMLAARASDQLPTSRDELYEEILAHERDYWAQTYRKTAGTVADAPLDVLNRAVACLTLRSPTTRAQTLAALRTVAELSDDAQWRETVRTTLTTCLQPGPGEALTLRPDPIADHLTLYELREDPELLGSALDGLEPEALVGALRQLNRAAAADPAGTVRMLTDWVVTGPDRWHPVLEVAAELGGIALAALHTLVDAAPAHPWLDELSRAIPFNAVGLPHLGLQVDTRRLEILRAGDNPTSVEIAELLQRLSHRQGNVGDRTGALASIAEAADLYGNLAKISPTALLPSLASALNNLSNYQSDTGDRAAALASGTEAVNLYRDLAKTSPTAFLPDLASALSNLSNHQSDSGDRAAALASGTEAVNLYRNLAKTSPTAFLPNFAMSLNNLSNHQSNTGDRAAALASGTEAAELYRNLAKTSPTAFLPNFAGTLNNLANRQSDTGDRAAALASITEAVKIRRDLAKTSPTAFLPSLAMSLNNLANHQSDSGDRAAALASITEAVNLYRDLAKTSPTAFLPDLASAVNNLSIRQGEAGDRVAALASITEAADLYRNLAKTSPTAFLPDLAGALNNLANHQSNAGARAAALASITEAADLYRNLTQTNPAAFLPNLAGTLNNLSVQQSDTGDRAAALASITEAADLYRDLAKTSPTAFLPNLASALNNLSVQQSDTGDRAAALASSTEAVKIRRDLARTSPAAFLPNLASALNNLAVQQSEAGDRAAALASITEAVNLYRDLAKTSPTAFLPDLAGALNNLSNRQSGTGDRVAALASITEAVKIRRDLARTSPAAFLPSLAMSLNNLSNRQSGTGDRAAALASITEAADLYRDLAKTSPTAFLPDLAGALNNLANHQSNAGDRAAALASGTEAADLYRSLAKTSPTAFLPNLAGTLNNLANHQSNTGDRAAALASIAEAADLFRDLAKTSPAAFLPNLAMSLNNLSNHQSNTGDRAAALASITEAVNLFRDLAKTNPAAFLPNLASALNNLSNRQSNAHSSSAAWQDALTVLEAHSLAQAELRAHYASYLTGHADTSLATNQLVIAALAATSGDLQALSRARHQIRDTAISLGIFTADLPDWATDPLPEESLLLLDEWAQATDWPGIEAFLRTHHDQLLSPEFRHHLHLATALFPGDQAIDSLTAVLAEADTDTLDAVLERGRRDHDVQLLLHTWVDTPTWAASRDFLDQHGSALRTPEMHAALSALDAPAARQHLALLQLADHLALDEVYAIAADPATATDHAFDAIDQADIPRLRQVLDARPDLLTGVVGAFLASVVTIADGDTEQARELAQTIAEHGTDIQRRAYAIRLRRLARLAPEAAGATELADLIHPG
ncbi:hypothetical protein [Kitasatospora sp. McL0602]|uniref:hypothetical protein n=1 Tax=Kitasatospora sp. McL0602 TaxID=3439530 RepID=UPI003F8BABAC